MEIHMTMAFAGVGLMLLSSFICLLSHTVLYSNEVYDAA
jgi:hypothetical protein